MIKGVMAGQADGDARELAAMEGPQRAAILLLMLGDKYGAPIWSMLTDEEVKKVSKAMAQLGSIEAKTVETLMIDFVSHLSQASTVNGTLDRTEELLSKVFPTEQVQAILADIKGASGRRMWQKLSQSDPEVFASFLRNEYPQTVAVILSRVSPEHASRVLAILPEEFATDVLNRMLRLDPVRKEALEHIEDTLRTEFVSALAQPARPDPHEMMAEVFNAFDRQTEARFLAALEHTNGESAKRIRELMFTFDDLGKLDAASVQTILRFVDRQVLGRALKAASESVRAFFFANMSSRAAKTLQDEMAGLGPIRLKDADEAQSRMVAIAKDLAAKGDIVISKGDRSQREEELVF